MRVLPADFGASPERRTQFEQEARGALLSHPNILTIHGIGTDANAAYIVSEPMDGSTLREGALPARTAIQYAAQIAHGLAAAHDQHTPLETMTAVAKSDPPTLAAAEGPLSPRLVRLVERCLKKHPASRPTAREAATALDALFEQASIASFSAPAAPVAETIDEPFVDAPVEPESAEEKVSRGRRLVPIFAVTGVLALLAALVPGATRIIESAWLGTVDPVASNVSSLPIATTTLPDRPVWEFAVSPDGQRLAVIAEDGSGQRQLWVRSLSTGGERPLANTGDAAFPFWSPDSRFIAYFAEGALRKVAADGGTPAVITDAMAASPGAWNGSDVIVFPRDAEGSPLYRVAANGGTAAPVTGLASGEAAHTGPVFLPDGRRFLYTIVPDGDGEPSVHAGSLDSMSRQLVLPDASRVALADGYIIFLRRNALTVQPFDPERLETRGDAVQIGASALAAPARAPVRAFSISSAGVLACQTGLPPDPERSRLAWFDRGGLELGTIGAPADYGDVSLSPDGARVAASVRQPDSDARDLVMLDVASGMRTPLTSDAANDSSPVWSPDGRRIVYASTLKGTSDIYQKPVSGAAREAVIAAGEGQQIPYDWSSDGRYLVYQTNQPGIVAGGNFDLWARSLGGGRPFAFWRTVHAATRPKFSPDRRWVAYTSLEGGREDVYALRFPHPEARRRISSRGGSWPRWRRDGGELFYVDPDNRLIAVPVKYGSTLEVGTPRPLFELRTKADRGYPYDVSADGQRILVNTAGEGLVPRPTTIIDWRARLQP
jgi:Tol biopolymer transport system component